MSNKAIQISVSQVYLSACSEFPHISKSRRHLLFMKRGEEEGGDEKINEEEEMVRFVIGSTGGSLADPSRSSPAVDPTKKRINMKSYANSRPDQWSESILRNNGRPKDDHHHTQTVTTNRNSDQLTNNFHKLRVCDHIN